MRRLEVAELVLLAAAASALAAALILFCVHNRRESRKRRPPAPELPLSQQVPTAVPAKTSRSSHLVVLLMIMLCPWRRQRARIEPAAASDSQADSSPAAAAAEGVASWTERWFGPASRALYTIDEEDGEDGDSEEQQEEQEQAEPPDTPFYTPVASPARPGW
ncbi:hypothetical protein SEVIR_5G471101v4 [Setaria viridis]|uniref:Uncharacterized protein n=3 Tax=Setaria TaxID=4554 RepID=A0A368RGK0_SETIT|nr:uncharacterized protein LOC101778692 [Setaria italica]XP_034595650.1 uncharacterized protein LOC117857236 [Setaria viridis]RCV29198.1 hypothetical protein SETIT_5G464900v2 [Setaria italica]